MVLALLKVMPFSYSVPENILRVCPQALYRLQASSKLTYHCLIGVSPKPGYIKDLLHALKAIFPIVSFVC